MERTAEEQWQADEQVRYLVDEADDLANDYGLDMLDALIVRLTALAEQKKNAYENALANIEAWRKGGNTEWSGGVKFSGAHRATADPQEVVA